MDKWEADFRRRAAALIASAITPEIRSAYSRGLRSLTRRRVGTFAELVKTLPNLRGNTGWVAIRLIGQFGRRAAVPVLLALLDDDSPHFGGEVEVQLAMLGGIRAQRRCVDLLRGKSSRRTRIAAAYALANMNGLDARGSEALLSCVRDRHDDPELRGYCAEGLNRYPPHRRRAATAAIFGLADPSPIVRFWCAFALAGLRYRPAIPALQHVAVTDSAVCPGMGRVADEARDAIAFIEGRPTQQGGWTRLTS